VLPRCLRALGEQTHSPELVIIVDNSSPHPEYLRNIPADYTVVRNDRNIGFCAANNVGYRLAISHTYILFLNPDAFLPDDFIEEAVRLMERPENSTIGCVTGALLGFEVEQDRPSGRLDSTGIFRTWYGRWYDRHQGRPASIVSQHKAEDLPAVCGALMFCRGRALADVAGPRAHIFDPSFFMYKEDIDLSLRLRQRGWRLAYEPALWAYHGRGWTGRWRMPARARYLSARNELMICLRYSWRYLPWSAAKLLFAAATSLPGLLRARFQGRGS
jgi:GT2 family glycosyltransferase